MSKKKSFVINRKKWYRGHEDESRLLRPSDGKMCCLGFFEKAICGLKIKDILDIGDPLELESESQPEWFFRNTKYKTETFSLDLYTLIQVNDNENLTESVREELIKNIFKKHNIKVKFVG